MDQEVLIAGNKQGSKINPVVLYTGTKVLPYVVHLCLCVARLTEFNILVVTVLLLIGDYWFSQNVHGPNMIGLRWWIQLNNGFQYYSKPDPFVPSVSDSNVFWVGFFVAIVVWIITSIVTVFTHGFFIAIISVIAAVFNIVNVTMFIKARKLAKIAAEHACLTILQDETINFELVKDDLDDKVPSSSPEEKETEIEAVSTTTEAQETEEEEIV